MSTAFYLFCGMGLVVVVATVVFSFSLTHLVKDPGDLKLFRILLVLVGLNVAMDFPVKVFSAVFSSNLRDDIGTGITIVKTVLNSICVVLALEKGYGIMGLALISVGFSVMDNIARIVLSYRLEPGISVSPRFFDKSKVRDLFGYSTYTFIGKIGDMLRFRLDQIVITAFIDLGSVTHFFVGVRLIEYLMEFITSKMRVVSPVFSQEEGRNDFESIRTKFLFVTKISLYTSVFTGLVTFFYAKPFLVRWMGPDFMDSYRVMQILMVPYIFALSQNPVVMVLYGVSKHKYVAYSNLLEGIANFGLSVLLVKFYGIYGVALGTAIPMFVNVVFARPWYVCRAIHLESRVYLEYMCKHFSVAALSFLPAYFVLGNFVSASYPSIVLFVSLQAFVYWPLILLLGFMPEERHSLFNKTKGAFGFADATA